MPLANTSDSTESKTDVSAPSASFCHKPTSKKNKTSFNMKRKGDRERPAPA
jgi:hypothetical protein